MGDRNRNRAFAPLQGSRHCFLANQAEACALLSRPWRPLSLVQATEAKVFHFDKLVDAVMRPFASKFRLLHSTERHDFGGNQAGVDADHSVFESLRNSPDAPDVAAKKITSETEFGI